MRKKKVSQDLILDSRFLILACFVVVASLHADSSIPRFSALPVSTEH